MSLSICLSFLFLGSSAQADIPPPKEPPAPVEAKTNKDVGEKGAWAESVKTEFLVSCNSSRPETISASFMNTICTCSMEKLETLYAPQDLGTPEVNEKSKEIVGTCAVGTKGAWSTLFKQQFIQGCEASKPEGITAPAMKNICSCSMGMLEVKYKPDELEKKDAVSFSAQAVEVCAKQELNK